MKPTLDTILALQLANSGSSLSLEVVKKEPLNNEDFELFKEGIINSIRIEGSGYIEARLYIDGKKEYEQTGEDIIYDILGLVVKVDNPTCRFEIEGEVESIRVIGLVI